MPQRHYRQSSGRSSRVLHSLIPKSLICGPSEPSQSTVICQGTVECHRDAVRTSEISLPRRNMGRPSESAWQSDCDHYGTARVAVRTAHQSPSDPVRVVMLPLSTPFPDHSTGVQSPHCPDMLSHAKAVLSMELRSLSSLGTSLSRADNCEG
jgi:hypothetical protein